MEKLKVGKIVGTHGLKGELKIRSNSDFNDERFKKNNDLIIKFNNQDVVLSVLSCRVHKGNYLVCFKEHQDINLVEKYIGSFVYANKDNDLLNENEYYYTDIIGCVIYQTNGELVGKVVDILDNGRHDVLIVNDVNNKKVSIPYVDAFVKDEDIENGKIIVELIKGMLNED